MIINSETVGPFVLAGLSVAASFIMPEVPAVDPTTVAGGGIGVAILWASRNAMLRVDASIALVRDAVDTWTAHLQRTENIHRVALRLHFQDEPGAPSQSMRDDVTPKPITVRDHHR